MKTREYFLENMNCPSCALKIENELKDITGVEDANVDLLGQRIIIKSENDVFDEAVRIVKNHETDVEVSRSKSGKSAGYSKDVVILSVYIVALIVSKIADLGEYNYVYSVVFIIIYLLTGKSVLKTATVNLKRGYIYDENFLMSIATLGAIAISAFEEAAGVMLFYRIGELLQAKAVENSKNTILDTTKFVSGVSHRIEGEEVVDIKPEGVVKGDLILVKPGETLPVDGELISEYTEFDQSSISGESLPVEIERGGYVVSGSAPLSGSVKIRAVNDFAESTTSKILELIADAPQNKSDREKFITKFSRYYTPVVVYLAVAIVFIPYFLQLAGIYSTTAGFTDHVYKGLVFLVISCPCALMLSVPLSFFANIGMAAKKGILVKGANFLESIKECGYILFDKTGTLTQGVFSVKKTVSFNGYSEKAVLETAAALELHSSHPIASAFKDFADDFQFNNINELPGMGIKGEVNSDVFYIGNEKLLRELSVDDKHICSENSYICLYVVKNDKIMGKIMLSDTLRNDAVETVKNIKERGVVPVIVSGDSKEVVSSVAAELGIEEYYFSLLPDQKLGILQKLRDKGHKVAAVGDGLNDTALLSYADVGIAMGQTAANLSVDMADIVILGSKLYKINDLYDISKKSLRLSSENIAIALGIKIAVMLASFFGMATLWAAVFADVGAALLTVLNSVKVFFLKSRVT